MPAKDGASQVKRDRQSTDGAASEAGSATKVCHALAVLVALGGVPPELLLYLAVLELAMMLTAGVMGARCSAEVPLCGSNWLAALISNASLVGDACTLTCRHKVENRPACWPASSFCLSS